jgi:hypothetical protein
MITFLLYIPDYIPSQLYCNAIIKFPDDLER